MQKLLVSIFTLLLSQSVLSRTLVESFLRKVQLNSVEYQVVELESQSNLLVNNIELAQFDVSAYLRGEYSDSKDVATSLFSPETTTSYNYSLGLNKKWSQGFETKLSYALTKNSILFQSRPELDYLSPDVNLTFKTNIIQDLFYGKSKSIKSKVKSLSNVTGINEQVKKKLILVNSLLTLSSLLEQKEEVKLQKNLCRETRSQSNKLRNKSKIGSIPKRDYLLSLKSMNDCKVVERNLTKSLSEKHEILVNEFGLEAADISRMEINSFFNEIVELYKNVEQNKTNLDLSKREGILLYKNQLRVAKLEGQELIADSKVPLLFELKLGLRGLDKEIDKSHENILDSTNPYIMGSLQLDLPFKNRKVSSKLQTNQIQQEILKRKIALEKSTSKYKFDLLSKNILIFIENYETSLANVKLSRLVLNEARRDFKIGRIDYLTLSEFQKVLIQSQKQLGTTRIAAVASILDYLDYFQYFSRYNSK